MLLVSDSVCVVDRDCDSDRTIMREIGWWANFTALAYT